MISMMHAVLSSFQALSVYKRCVSVLLFMLVLRIPKYDIEATDSVTVHDCSSLSPAVFAA